MIAISTPMKKVNAGYIKMRKPDYWTYYIQIGTFVYIISSILLGYLISKMPKQNHHCQASYWEWMFITNSLAYYLSSIAS